tara:strand:- start:1055 stop:1843 length:789 start_codon:yes stop_codon:yes gene_type:complete
MDLSIIIPVYNSEKIISTLVKKIFEITKLKKLKSEIILIDDFSKDNSWTKIKNLKKKYKFIKGVNLQSNYGQHNAIMAGLNFSKGKFCVLMDDDMQHDPKYIIDIYHKLREGYSICYVKYLKRKHLKWKIFVSWLNNIIASVLALKSVKIYTSSFKGFNKKILKGVIKYKEKEVFIDWLILEQSKDVAVINVIHQKRHSGKTNYDLKKLLELWSIMIMKIKPRSIIHNIWLILPQIFVKFLLYPIVKKNNISEQYKIKEKIF